MKKKWFRAMDLVDEQYILEADPGKDSARKGSRRRIISVLASCACFVLVLCSAWLFLPYDTTPPSVEEHTENAYYPVIERLSMLKWEAPKYQNNFEMLKDLLPWSFRAGVKGDAMPENAAPEDAGGIFNGLMDGSANSDEMATGGTYEEITDNQVAGVTEADRIKRTDKYIFYLDESTLRVYSIAGLDSQELSNISLLGGTYNYYIYKWEFYLAADGKTATVMAMYLDENKKPQVCVISLDVSDPQNITEKNRVEVTGSYLSSRVTGGEILLMTEFVLNKKDMDFEDEKTFLPQINGESVPMADIVLPEEVNSARYTVVLKLDENTLAVEGKAAFLSYTEDVYVSRDHIYLTNVYADVQKGEDDWETRNSVTEIICLAYQNGFEKKGSVTVRGYVKDQWSMDEYEGILRVVTTTNATSVRETHSGNSVSAEILMTATGNSNASLYCIDLQSFEVIASVEDFAPPREEVQSVRFDKTTAYVCTSIEMSDPVFFFDLSDLSNITYKDTGTIDGFSTSLVDFGDGYLLGIGQEDWSTFKAEIYQETEDGVEGFCSYTAEAAYATEYKSYYIDRENRLLGLGLTTNSGISRYVVLFFDGYDLVEVVSVELAGNNSYKRGVYIDGFMYMFGRQDFKVEKVF